MGFLDRLRRHRHVSDAAHSLYSQAMAQARQPAFYAELGVPDTLDGRFDMLVVHVFLLLHRLKDGDAQAELLSQAIFDLMFRDMDRSLRELGVGDHAVGKRVKQMLRAFYGRMRAYEEGLADPSRLAEALKRNVYRDGVVDDEALFRLVAYVTGEAARLRAHSLAALARGEAGFDGGAPVQTDEEFR